MAEHGGKKWTPRKKMGDVGGRKGKLHDELHIPEDKTIPQSRLRAAERSDKPEVARDAKRAETMEHWDHHGRSRRKKLYG